jgi:putative transposase
VTETYRFIASEANTYPASILCRLLGVSRSGYYAWRERPEGQDQLAPQVEEVFWRHSRRYGSRRITAELRAQAVIGRHRVRRLMREQGLQATAAAALCATHDRFPARSADEPESALGTRHQS